MSLMVVTPLPDAELEELDEPAELELGLDELGLDELELGAGAVVVLLAGVEEPLHAAMDRESAANAPTAASR